MINRIRAFAALGEYIRTSSDDLHEVILRAKAANPWFTEDNTQKALTAIAEDMLDKGKLEAWVTRYAAPASEGKRVGLVLAGNIPLVGFHDVLSVMITGHKAVIKQSEKDNILLPHLLQKLTEISPKMANYYEITEKLAVFDAVIATGSNNTARYFEQYFGKVPHIIRGHRNAVAVLDGTETTEQLMALGQDVFQFFGLGCRNVSKFYLPVGYDFNPLMECLHEYNQIIWHDKYKHNFDYNYALYIINKVLHVANGCIILTENKAIASRIAGAYYEFYSDINALSAELQSREKEIQCVVSNKPIAGFQHYLFGEAQHPALHDYADQVDTMAFLVTL